MCKLLLVILSVFLVSHTEVVPFDNGAIEKIFQDKKAALFLFTSTD